MRTSHPFSRSLQRSSPHFMSSSRRSDVRKCPRGHKRSCRRFFCRSPRCRAEQQERSDGLCGRPGIAVFVRHALQDLVCDLTIFRQWAVCFKHHHDRLERVAMHTHDPLDFPRAIGGMSVECIACAVPVGQLRAFAQVCKSNSWRRGLVKAAREAMVFVIHLHYHSSQSGDRYGCKCTGTNSY